MRTDMREEDTVDVRKFLRARAEPEHSVQPTRQGRKVRENTIALILVAMVCAAWAADELGWIEINLPNPVEFLTSEPFEGLAPIECAMVVSMTNSLIEMQRLTGTSRRDIRIPDMKEAAKQAVVRATARCKTTRCVQRLYDRCSALNPR